MAKEQGGFFEGERAISTPKSEFIGLFCKK
ncbi:hypothetical protein FHR92_001932 [Fontibacillus solani]|uniref:Uncharacterized protein n=1 Tax=Fontibacillus solani TaxID=1572857 RepID=A0A7W3SSL8_9BACL|nr:hypothetical protein [Fontibacillus solani]